MVHVFYHRRLTERVGNSLVSFSVGFSLVCEAEVKKEVKPAGQRRGADLMSRITDTNTADCTLLYYLMLVLVGLQVVEFEVCYLLRALF